MKYYFQNKESEMCYLKEYFINEMKKIGVNEIEVFEAVKTKDEEYIYCNYHGVTEKGYCGNLCSDYSPRNSKSGICKMQKNLYEIGKKVKLKL